MIKLSKGSTINLAKENDGGLTNVYFGLDWGAIKKSGGFLSSFLGGEDENVDLDAVAIILNAQKQVIDTVYFGSNGLKSKDGCVTLSGDDRTGDKSGDKKGDDNEIITCLLNKINTQNVKYIVFSLSSFTGHSFDEIPYASLNIYTKDNNTKKVLARLELTNNPEFKGAKGMVMGYAQFGIEGWEFVTIARPSKASKVSDLSNVAPGVII